MSDAYSLIIHLAQHKLVYISPTSHGQFLIRAWTYTRPSADMATNPLMHSHVPAEFLIKSVDLDHYIVLDDTSQDNDLDCPNPFGSIPFLGAIVGDIEILHNRAVINLIDLTSGLATCLSIPIEPIPITIPRYILQILSQATHYVSSRCRRLVGNVQQL